MTITFNKQPTEALTRLDLDVYANNDRSESRPLASGAFTQVARQLADGFYRAVAQMDAYLAMVVEVRHGRIISVGVA